MRMLTVSAWAGLKSAPASTVPIINCLIIEEPPDWPVIVEWLSLEGPKRQSLDQVSAQIGQERKHRNERQDGGGGERCNLHPCMSLERREPDGERLRVGP